MKKRKKVTTNDFLPKKIRFTVQGLANANRNQKLSSFSNKL